MQAKYCIRCPRLLVFYMFDRYARPLTIRRMRPLSLSCCNLLSFQSLHRREHAVPTPPSYPSLVAYVQTTQDLETDRRRLQETLRREVEARKRVDRMLRGYKDEVN